MSSAEAVDLVVFGAGGHAVSVAEVARSAGWRVLAFVDAQRERTTLLGLPVIGRADAMLAAGAAVAVAIGETRRASASPASCARACPSPASRRWCTARPASPPMPRWAPARW